MVACGIPCESGGIPCKTTRNKLSRTPTSVPPPHTDVANMATLTSILHGVESGTDLI